MTELTNREIVEHFRDAMNANDLDAADQFLAEDLIEDYPQSGERIRGRANRRAVIERYPGRDKESFIQGTQSKGMLVGDDQWVMTPAMTLIRLNGSGERFTATGTVTYPNGEIWYLIWLIEVRGGKIAKFTTYFAPPFEPAPYRAPYVERMPPE